MQWRGPYTVESRVGANDYRVKMGSKTKTYHVNMLKKYISREPEENVVPVDDTDGATVAVAGVIHQDVDPELGEVPDLEGYHQREGVRDVKLGDELPEDQQRVLKDLVRRYPDVFTDMPGETDVIQHQIRLTDDMPISNRWCHCDDKHITETDLLTLLDNVYLVFCAKEVGLGT